jgi:hypothetical protein
MSDEPFDPSNLEDAISVTTLIGKESGQWVLYLEVAFADGVRRHRIQAYRSEQQARVAATYVLRGALRDKPFRDQGH